MTYDEKVRGAALLGDVGKALASASFDDARDLVRLTLALERLANFFGTQLSGPEARNG